MASALSSISSPCSLIDLPFDTLGLIFQFLCPVPQRIHLLSALCQRLTARLSPSLFVGDHLVLSPALLSVLRAKPVIRQLLSSVASLSLSSQSGSTGRPCAVSHAHANVAGSGLMVWGSAESAVSLQSCFDHSLFHFHALQSLSLPSRPHALTPHSDDWRDVEAASALLMRLISRSPHLFSRLRRLSLPLCPQWSADDLSALTQLPLLDAVCVTCRTAVADDGVYQCDAAMLASLLSVPQLTYLDLSHCITPFDNHYKHYTEQLATPSKLRTLLLPRRHKTRQSATLGRMARQGGSRVGLGSTGQLQYEEADLVLGEQDFIYFTTLGTGLADGAGGVEFLRLPDQPLTSARLLAIALMPRLHTLVLAAQCETPHAEWHSFVGVAVSQYGVQRVLPALRVFVEEGCVAVSVPGEDEKAEGNWDLPFATFLSSLPRLQCLQLRTPIQNDGSDSWIAALGSMTDLRSLKLHLTDTDFVSQPPAALSTACFPHLHSLALRSQLLNLDAASIATLLSATPALLRLRLNGCSLLNTIQVMLLLQWCCPRIEHLSLQVCQQRVEMQPPSTGLVQFASRCVQQALAARPALMAAAADGIQSNITSMTADSRLCLPNLRILELHYMGTALHADELSLLADQFLLCPLRLVTLLADHLLSRHFLRLAAVPTLRAFNFGRYRMRTGLAVDWLYHQTEDGYAPRAEQQPLPSRPHCQHTHTRYTTPHQPTPHYPTHTEHKQRLWSAPNHIDPPTSEGRVEQLCTWGEDGSEPRYPLVFRMDEVRPEMNGRAAFFVDLNARVAEEEDAMQQM